LKVKTLLNDQLKNEANWADFLTYKRISYWQPFMHTLAGIQYTLSIVLVYLVCTSQMKNTIEAYSFYALMKKV